MATQFPTLTEAHVAFIRRQRIFFVASAAGRSRVNCSPRGTDCFRCLDGNRVAYLDKTGSGNETSAHLRAGGNMTIMFCAVEGPPLILRLYGIGTVHRRTTVSFADLLTEHFDGLAPPGTRQIITLDVNLVQSSCGYGVPSFDYVGERDTLDRWAAQKGEEGVERYRREKNVTSLDGLPTGLLDEQDDRG